jgi:hypothetical protein
MIRGTRKSSSATVHAMISKRQDPSQQKSALMLWWRRSDAQDCMSHSHQFQKEFH